MTQIVPQSAQPGLPPPDGAADDPRVCRTRAAVMAAARQLLDEEGWDAVTHVAVAERSGVGRSTLYRHWPDATSLLRDLIAESVRAERPSLTGDLRRDLVDLLDSFRRRLLDPTCSRGMATVIERATVDEHYARLRASLTGECTAPLADTLRGGVRRGLLDDRTDVPRAVDELCGPLVFRRFLARRQIPASYVGQLVDDFLRAHRPRQPTTQEPGAAPLRRTVTSSRQVGSSSTQ